MTIVSVASGSLSITKARMSTNLSTKVGFVDHFFGNRVLLLVDIGLLVLNMHTGHTVLEDGDTFFLTTVV